MEIKTEKQRDALRTALDGEELPIIVQNETLAGGLVVFTKNGVGPNAKTIRITVDGRIQKR